MQKAMVAWCPFYEAGNSRCKARSLATIANLTDALASVGNMHQGSPYGGNLSLREVNACLVDWFFQASVSLDTEGSQLDDATALVLS